MFNLAMIFPGEWRALQERMERWQRTLFWPWICKCIFIWTYILWMLFFHASGWCDRKGGGRKLHDGEWAMKGSLLLCCPHLWESCWWEIFQNHRCLPAQAEPHTTIWREEKEGTFVGAQELTHNLSVLAFLTGCKSSWEKGWRRSERN